MFRPITSSAHGPNHPTARPVNCEVFSLAWAEPSVYAAGASRLRGPKRLTVCEILKTIFKRYHQSSQKMFTQSNNTTPDILKTDGISFFINNYQNIIFQHYYNTIYTRTHRRTHAHTQFNSDSEVGVGRTRNGPNHPGPYFFLGGGGEQASVTRGGGLEK